MKRKHIVFFLTIFLSLNIAAQQNEGDSFDFSEETGIVPIQNYSTKDYDGGPQNFAVIQSNKGLLYFANSRGLLEYDGVSWRMIPLPNTGPIRSLAKTKNDRIYVGGYNELGYLEPNAIGELQFVSLKKYLDKRYQIFKNIWNIHVIGEDVYFQERDLIFLWRDQQFEIIKSESLISASTIINNELYIADRNKIIKKWVHDSFTTVFDASGLVEKKIVDILPYNQNELLILTQREGIFVLKENKLRVFESKVNTYLKEKTVYQGIRLNNGSYSFATISGGIVIINDSGKMLQLLDKSYGLVDDAIYAQVEDRHGRLWLAANNGISRVELQSPFTVFDDRLGLDGFINRIHRHNEKLYAANFNGVFYMDHIPEKKKSIFKPVPGISSQTFYFLSLGDTLISASRGGLDFIANQQVVQHLDLNSGALLRSKLDKNRIYVGLRDGLASIKYENGTWKDEGRIPGPNDDIRKIVEQDNGDLWLESQEMGFWKVNMSAVINTNDFHNLQVKQYRPKKELPEGIWFLHKIRGAPSFNIGRHPYKYDATLDSIVPDSTFARLFGLKGQIAIKKEDKHGNIWMWAELEGDDFRTRVVAMKQNDSSYTIKKIYDDHTPKPLGISLLPEDNGIAWYGGEAGIVRHDINSDAYYKKDFNSHIRRITVNADSLIFGGAKVARQEVSLPFQFNEFRIEFAATSFDDESKNMYQFYLEGFDKDWSQWTYETRKDYTNIPEGEYTFKLRAKNIYGHLGKEDSYSFSVLPPWYRSWWAYALYALVITVGISLIFRWRSAQLRHKNIALETIINERTREINEKNETLRLQAEKLQEIDAMKTRFFANISHEFRTPLTLIKGPIEKLKDTNQNKISTTNIRMIQRNTNRLLKLVNQLLDLSKLDSGKLQLELSEGDVFRCIRAAASSFSSHAAQRGMDYQVKISSRLLWASFDRDKLENIIYNLLSNAFKFTNNEGKIVITSLHRHNKLYITVSDTGHGIHKKKLSNIFDRFFQVDDSYTREKEGSGIGLALTKELTELMGGEIYVESEYGKGSLFKIIIPIEEIKSHKADEIENTPVVFDEDEEEIVVTKTRKENHYTVLIVEDNDDMRHFIKEQLMQDYTIIQAGNGKTGLQKAVELVPDLIITDLMMPQMDGLTLCKRLKTTIGTSHIPVIMLTAKAGIENKLEGLEIGADDYLTKPFNAREVSIRVKNLIEERKKLRELFGKNITIDPKEVVVTSLDQQFLEQTMKLLEEQYHNSEFGVPQMQVALSMSKTQLQRKLKALTDSPPGELLRNFRLKRAAQLLSQKGEHISQVIYAVGFNSLSYFTKRFKEFYGVSPSEYVKKHSNDA